MAVRQVVNYPARVLKGLAGPVGAIGDPERQLAADLVDTMYDAPGCVGLAAPQLGVPLRAFALDVSVMKKPPGGNHGLVVLFDPELVLTSGSELKREGCMSVPDFTCDVRRATGVVVRGTTPEGEHRVVEAEGFEARAFQHELDHLDGLLILDRVASARTDVFRRKRYADRGEHLK
ncbi:MAG: peptide deformylase [Actinobacteria bacterium]|nr:peptide deformylase [Actinomycetota bacterium]